MTERARRFSYLLRPAKQVERKLIVQAMHRLRDTGYQVGDYRYLGFGSIYYADFLLFHRYLYIDDMVCAESGPFQKSMRFNLPFDFIKLDLRPVVDLIPELDRERQHLVWLDYDYGLTEPVLHDLGSLVTTLPRGSIVIATVKAAPPEAIVEGEGEACRLERRTAVRDRFSRDLGNLAPSIELSDLTKPKLAHILATALSQHLGSETGRRGDGLQFRQLFSYRYSDGAQMLTVGGILEAPDEYTTRLESFTEWKFAQVDPSGEPIEIGVPWLTSREKNWLDQRLSASLVADDLEFDLEDSALDAFRSYYREYPSYFESLL